MSKRIQISAVLAVVLLGGTISAAAQGDYDYQAIDYPGVPITQVFGINQRGDVVGNGFDFVSPVAMPFVYDSKKGDFTDVGPVAGFADAAILGIADSGSLAGSVVSLDLLTESGLYIDQDGSITVFDHPDAVSITAPRGVNNKGLVTGYRDSPDDQFSPENGFIYDTKTGTFTDIVPSLFTIPHGINSKGEVVGSAIFFNADDPCPPTPGGIVRYGWLRTADGTVTYFDVNGGRTSARGITDSGTIAGFVTDTVSGATNGFVVELDGSQCQSITVAAGDLLEFPGAVATFVGGIKNSGEVVGSYNDAAGNIHGYIATPQ